MILTYIVLIALGAVFVHGYRWFMKEAQPAAASWNDYVEAAEVIKAKGEELVVNTTHLALSGVYMIKRLFRR